MSIDAVNTSTMNRTDEELDADWQPSGRRPQSTIARSFSDELMNIFRIDNSLTDLDEQVTEKKRAVNRNTQELASLEKRLREMEERLQRNNGGGNFSRAPLPQVQQQKQEQLQPLDAAAKEDQKARSRPGTARATQQAPSAGNMPPTPGGSEDGDHE